MTNKLRNRFIEDEEQAEGFKHLPDAFDDTKDELSFGKSVFLSLVLHPVVLGGFWLTVTLLTLWGLLPDEFKKPPMKNQDIEFVLTQNKEQMPINKNTKLRSDKNTRAGGKHDPTRKVSEPSPAPAPKQTPSPAPQPKQQAKEPVKTPPKVQQNPIQKMLQPTPAPTPAPPKPAAPKPSAAPVARPSAEAPKPQMPKISTNPKSPFAVDVPKTNAPVGPAPSYGSGTSSGSSGGSTSSSGSGSGMPAPQFSASKGSSSGSSGTGSRGSQGSYGSGNLGNPSPGNRAGAPGVDALAQPNWGAYMAEVERRVKRNWTPPKGEESRRVVVYFKIGRDGRLLNIRISKSSGVPLADQAAKAAIELSAPFRPLPPEYKDQSIDIDFTFDYNVVGANYR